jgi:hypothetical protein
VLTAIGYEEAADTLVGCVKVLADDREKLSELLSKELLSKRAAAPLKVTRPLRPEFQVEPDENTASAPASPPWQDRALTALQQIHLECLEDGHNDSGALGDWCPASGRQVTRCGICVALVDVTAALAALPPEKDPT